jgi:hypothetical protein
MYSIMAPPDNQQPNIVNLTENLQPIHYDYQDHLPHIMPSEREMSCDSLTRHIQSYTGKIQQELLARGMGSPNFESVRDV